MLWGAHGGGIEVRTAGGETRLTARFPYGRETEMAPGRFENFAARAFAARIESGADIHLLAGHDFNRPLASRAAGSLTLTDGDDALTIEAVLSAEAQRASWTADFMAANSAGLIRGLSPGFRVPRGGERIEQRGDGLHRTIVAADLFELSAVTRPAYPDAQIEARSWQPNCETTARAHRALNRWRV